MNLFDARLKWTPTVAANRQLVAEQQCEEHGHEYEYKEDWSGDPGVIGGTFTISWLECSNCGHQAPASTADRPTFDDYN